VKSYRKLEGARFPEREDPLLLKWKKEGKRGSGELLETRSLRGAAAEAIEEKFLVEA